MEEIVKLDKGLATICKGEDKKNDAMMMMSPECNWDQFLTPAPCAIALLGELFLISANTDFTLEENPPKDGFKLLRYPKSFRASLVQVSNAGWLAFNEAHTSIDKIHLYSGNVDGHIKNAVRFLLEGTPDVVERMLPMSLKKVKTIADDSLQFATNIEEGFINVMELTAELLEASTNTKGVYEEKKKETEIAIKVAKTEKECRDKEIAQSQKRLENMEEEVKHAQKDFKDAMANTPTGCDLLCLRIGEVVVDLVKTVTSIPSNAMGTARGVKRRHEDDDYDADDHDDDYYDRQISRKKIYTQIVTMTQYVQLLNEVATSKTDDDGKPCPDFTRIGNGEIRVVESQLKKVQTNVNAETKSGCLKRKVLEICEDSFEICDTLRDLHSNYHEPEKKQQLEGVMERVRCISTKSHALDVEARKAHGKGLDNKSPNLSKMGKSSNPSIVQSTIENHRYKTENAKETLRDAKTRQDKEADELKKANEKLTKVLSEMAKLDLQNIDFETIRDTLVKGIKALTHVREQWGKLVRFFQMLSNLIKCCLDTSVTDFVDNSRQAREIRMTDHSQQISDIFKDIIFEQASKASQVAYVVRSISGTYVEISNKHLMDRITCLGHLIALDPKTDENEIKNRRLELHNGCNKAQKAILDIVQQQKAEFNQNIERRIQQITELEAKMPPIDPKRIEEIKESISIGSQSFCQQEMDNLI